MRTRSVLSVFTIVVLAVFIVSCVAPAGSPPTGGEAPAAGAAEPEPLSAQCVGFEDLTLGTIYHVGDTFADSGVQITATDFQWGSGTPTSGGFAEVENGGKAGGSGQDLEVNNILLKFDFGAPISGLLLRFGEYGGNLNIEINGDFVNFGDFVDIDGTVIGGVTVSVTNGGGNDQGTLQLSGTINSFAIGGQELWIDDVCPQTVSIALDHFNCYVTEGNQPVDVPVILNDQFGSEEVKVLDAVRFCNPVAKIHDDQVTEIQNPDHHLKFYQIKTGQETPERMVVASNQFGEEQKLTVTSPVFLAVPTQKTAPESHEPPQGLDHFKCYKASGDPVETPVKLKDQFQEMEAVVIDPLLLCNPAEKIHEDQVTPIQNPDAHLVCYGIKAPEFQTDVKTANQFGEEGFVVTRDDLLCVPSKKNVPPPSLDHFNCYITEGNEPVGVTVTLNDQFGTEEARVREAGYFCNPVAKIHDDQETPIQNPDHHLKFYRIVTGQEAQERTVMASNQFGEGQKLTVIRPVFLAVPTQKMTPNFHEPPQGLDHFKCYEAVGTPVDIPLNLKDQFQEMEAIVHEPRLLCNPVEKIHDDPVTPIQNPEAHLVCYGIEAPEFAVDNIRTANQFEQSTLFVIRDDLLCVPSKKEVPPPPPVALDHFNCYIAEGNEPVGVSVILNDQFVSEKVEVLEAGYFCNPVAKIHDDQVTEIQNPDHHLKFYKIQTFEQSPERTVVASNQFGEEQKLTVTSPTFLAVPTQKTAPESHEPPQGLDHFKCYEASGDPIEALVSLKDQFQVVEFTRLDPRYLCNPVEKVHDDQVTPILNPDAHLVCYRIEAPAFQTDVKTANQFGEEGFVVTADDLLCVPSKKTVIEQ